MRRILKGKPVKTFQVATGSLLEYRGYSGSLKFSQKDEVFHGKILGINDTVTFEAENSKRLIKAFHDAVDDYLETCKAFGKDPDKEYRGVFNVRIKPELHRRIYLRSRAMNISLNKYIENIIAKEVLHSKQD